MANTFDIKPSKKFQGSKRFYLAFLFHFSIFFWFDFASAIEVPKAPPTFMDIMQLQIKTFEIQRNAITSQVSEDWEKTFSFYSQLASLSMEIQSQIDLVPEPMRTTLSPTRSTASQSIFLAFREMSYCLQQMHRLDAASENLDKAISILTNLNDEENQIDCLGRAASLKFEQKQFLSASVLYNRLIGLIEKRIEKFFEGFQNSSKEPLDLSEKLKQLNRFIVTFPQYQNAADVASRLGDLEGARKIFRLPGFKKMVDYVEKTANNHEENSSKGIFGSLDGQIFNALKGYSSEFFYVSFHINQGILLNKMKQFEDALIDFASAGARLKPESSLELEFGVKNNQGVSYCELGKREAARDFFQKAFELSSRLSPQYRQTAELTSRLNLSWVNREIGSYTESLDHAEKAEKIARLMNSPKPVFPHFLWPSLKAKGLALYCLDRYEEAFLALEESIKLIEEYRARLGTEQFRRGFMEDKVEAYDTIIRVLLRLNRNDKAFFYVEKAKARAFVDLLGCVDKSKLIKNKAPQKLRDDIEKNEAELGKIEGLIEKGDRGLKKPPLSENKKTSGDESLPEVSLNELETLRHDQKKLAEMVGAEFSDLTEASSLNLEKTSAFIDKETIVLEFFQGAPEKSILAFVINPSTGVSSLTTTIIELSCSQKSLQFHLSQFKSLMEISPDTFSEELHTEAKTLFKMLISPLFSHLNGKKRVVLVPQGIIHNVPFASLEDEEGNPLIEKFDLVSLPSLTTLFFCRQKNPKKRETLFAYALGKSEDFNISSLPGTLKEVDSITNLFPREKTKVFRGSELLPERFGNDASDFDIIHLATHGLLEPASPFESSILFGSNPLFVKEVMSLSLNASIVTLSACQSGLGKLYGGDEMVGLTRAFIYAGTPSVLSSLWPVSDEATSLLMSSFYDHWISGCDKANALKKAMLEVRKKYQSPRCWSSFVLSGDWL